MAKIYTKGGDKGKTSLVGGQRVLKHHNRLEAYGTIDELNSHIGLLESYIVNEKDKQCLLTIQNLLFEVGSYLATDSENNPTSTIEIRHVEQLEHEMDAMEEELEPLREFILPSGSISISQAHVCRTVCRRAERRVNLLNNESELDKLILMYINRLSDYFFVFARYLAKHEKIKEITWTKGC